jgi:hypothetical protein
VALCAIIVLVTGFAEWPDRFIVVCAGCALVCSVLGLGGRARATAGAPESAAWVTGAAAALFLAGGAAGDGFGIIRELVNGAPLETGPPGAAMTGSIGWVLLAVACLVQLAGPRPAPAVAALFGVLILGAMRLSLSMPALAPGPAGGWTRGSWSLVLLASLGGVLWAFVIAHGWVQAWRRARWFAGDLARPAPEPIRWPGFRVLCVAVGLLLLLLVCFHFAVGFDVAGLSGRLVALMVACVSGGSGVAMLVLLRNGQGDNLADLGMGLVSLAICSAAVMTLPQEPAALAQRYPLILNVTLAALALVVWFWAWLGCVWEQQLDGGAAWTVAGSLIRNTVRLALFAGLLGLAMGLLMTIWPRLGVAPDMDHSLGRIAGGVAGHLLLLWAVLWSARRLKRSSFSGLAVLTVISMLGFVYVRWVPLTTAVF